MTDAFTAVTSLLSFVSANRLSAPTTRPDMFSSTGLLGISSTTTTQVTKDASDSATFLSNGLLGTSALETSEEPAGVYTTRISHVYFLTCFSIEDRTLVFFRWHWPAILHGLVCPSKQFVTTKATGTQKRTLQHPHPFYLSLAWKVPSIFLSCFIV